MTDNRTQNEKLELTLDTVESYEMGDDLDDLDVSEIDADEMDEDDDNEAEAEADEASRPRKKARN